MLTIDQIAEVCHEANRAYCRVLGDDSQLSWADAPDWQRKSAIAGVRHHIDNPGSRPEDSHKCWLQVKLADGWKYGAVKDPSRKEHPCCVPYGDLPPEQQLKDFLFLNVVDTLTD